MNFDTRFCSLLYGDYLLFYIILMDYVSIIIDYYNPGDEKNHAEQKYLQYM